jgi:3-phosphoshikimate 1-carboxyvinyltransferase
MAALTNGVSHIEYPLDSLDARSCVNACRALGAEVGEYRAADSRCANPADGGGEKLVRWTVRGLPGNSGAGGINAGAINVGNSGTTLFLALAAAALGSSPVCFTGDEQIRRRSAGPLLEALRGLGVRVDSAPGGCAPITVQGPWRGGRVSLECPTSQYLSALLLAAPLAPSGTFTEIEVPLLNEKPYAAMTLSYLNRQGVPREEGADFSYFRIPGGAAYRPINGPVPGDFSSAAFPAAAAVIGGGPLTIWGLDPGDSQGDRAFFGMLAEMGCQVRWKKEAEAWTLTLSRPEPLRGGVFDLNATPDLLPVMAVLACYAQGETALVNVAHARIKETDRIAVMAQELGRLGADITERPDGLLIRGGRGLKGGRVRGHGDHRVVMAMAVAALGQSGTVEIDDAESAAITYPGFLELLNSGTL